MIARRSSSNGGEFSSSEALRIAQRAFCDASAHCCASFRNRASRPSSCLPCITYEGPTGGADCNRSRACSSSSSVPLASGAGASCCRNASKRPCRRRCESASLPTAAVKSTTSAARVVGAVDFSAETVCATPTSFVASALQLLTVVDSCDSSARIWRDKMIDPSPANAAAARARTETNMLAEITRGPLVACKMLVHAPSFPPGPPIDPRRHLNLSSVQAGAPCCKTGPTLEQERKTHARQARAHYWRWHALCIGAPHASPKAKSS